MAAEWELEILDLAVGGRGLTRSSEGQLIFVEGALPGEIVRAQLTKSRKDYLEARTLEVLRPSGDRTVPACMHYQMCGGCDFMHLTYPAQLQAKAAWVKHNLRRLTDLPEARIVASPLIWGYRNRLRLQGREGRLGFFARHSHDLVELSACPVAVESVNKLWRELLPQLKKSAPDWLEFLAGEQAFLTLGWLDKLPKAARDLNIQAEGLTGRRLAGGELWEKWEFNADSGVCYFQRPELRLWAFPGQFCQVNFAANYLLIDVIKQMAGSLEGSRVLDLYAGSGNLSLPLAQAGAQVLALEGNEEACEAGAFNARINQLSSRCSWLPGPIKRELPKLAGQAWDLLVLDPPRAGAKEIMPALLALRPARIIYVSCHSAALARDAQILQEAGYRPQNLTVLDMFPHTSQVETILSWQLE